jgi:hypothetical protein
VTRHSGDDGTVLHAEPRLGDVVVMLATAEADYRGPTLEGRSTGSGLYLLVDDVDARPSRRGGGRGDPGSGKRRLLAEVVARVDVERKLRVGGYEPEGRVPFAARLTNARRSRWS